MGKDKRETEVLTTSLVDLLATLATENKKRRENIRTFNWFFGILVGAVVLLQLALWFSGKSPSDFTSYSSLFVLIGAGAAFTGTHKAALRRLEELAIPESAGFLVEAYATSLERDVTEVSERALLKALPLVNDAESFDDYQRGLLYKSLKKTKSADLAEAILDVTRRIGGSEAIPYLEEFRGIAAKRKGAEWERLSNRALGALPDLRLRVARAIIEQKVREDQERSSAEQELHLPIR